MALAPSLKVTRGRKLRMDGTVVATNIHHPTDSPWRYDGVRVRGRTLVKAKQVVQQVPSLARHAFRDRTRSAKRQMQRLMAAARQRERPADERMRMAYQRLLTMTTAMVEQAERVGAVLKSPAVQTGQRLAATLDGVVPVVPQVITQTTRRVGHGEAVPAAE